MIISNTSPITNLAAIGELDLLRELYGTVYIPNAVFYEIVHKAGGSAGSTEIQNYSWIITESISDTKTYQLIRNALHEGESEVLTLALEKNASGVLLDEMRARQIAKKLSIPHIGLIGVLADAKSQGYIAKMKPYLDKLRLNGFWLSDKTYQVALSMADEMS